MYKGLFRNVCSTIGPWPWVAYVSSYYNFSGEVAADRSV